MRSFIASALPLVLLASQAQAGVTVYTGVPSTSTSSDAASATFYQGLPAYDPLTLQAPDPPQPPVTSYGLTVPPTEQALTDTGRTLSVKQKGNFLGFSIELSVAASILGTSAANLKVPFLNYLANIRNRAGQGAIVRVGGNTQESSTLYPDGTEDGEMIEKIKEEGASVTSTPTINYSPELFYAMANISAITDTEWFFGLPFNQSDVDNQIPNIPEIAQYAQQILGSKLLGLQLGNEPDLYSDHNKRPAGYTPADYNSEFQTIKQDILKDARLEQQQFLVGPSICCEVEGFELDDVLSAGWLTDNLDQIAMVAVQHYPENNCGINGRVVDSQEVFPTYLNHTSAVSLVQPYLDGTNQVLAAGKNIMMMEYGTASCGGFPGVSDSFGAALWTVDYALQMAAQNFTSALMHIGGQNVYYNAFTPPPTNLSRIGYQWTTGSVYYPTLFIAEAFGSSNNSQVVDLQADNDNIYHPAYAIYENGAPSRLALLNFVSDASGASDLSVTIDFNGTALPRGTVDVRYLSAASVSEKYEIYWANQTTRTSFASDGRLYGDVETVSIQCDTGANTCVIPLKAPSAAVVFLTDSALSESTNADSATATFATSVINVGSATIDSGALSTGNGMAGQPSLGSNSKGSVSSGQKVTAGLWAVGWTVLVSSLTLGVWGIRR